MTFKLNVLLVLVLIASALLLVKTSYESRRVFAQLDKARGEHRRLEIEYKRLDAERQAQATNLRVEKVARERLRMRAPVPGVIEYVDDPAAVAARPPVRPGAADDNGLRVADRSPGGAR
jgi:cell division protein FtsL